MDLKDALNAVRSGWWLVVGAVLLAMAVAGVLTWRATPMYASSSRLFVSTSAATDTAQAYQGDLFSQQRVTSYAQLLGGDQLAARVVDDLQLAMTPAQLVKEVTATAVPNTVILEVTVTDPSPRRAHDIVASLDGEFTQQVTRLETPDGSPRSTVKVATVQEPSYDMTPVSPDKTRNLVLGFGLGILLGLGLAVLRSRLDDTVKTPEAARGLAGAGVIGTVLEDPVLAREHLVADLDEHSISAESYRSIRTNLQFLDVDNPPRAIVVSSSVPGEGKSTLAVNLAVVLAQSGSRVMLIEADLRRPRITRYLNLISGAGLTNVLAGTAAMHEVAQPWGDGRLTVLGAGPMPPNPSEMLGSAQMRVMLDQLRLTYDYVVIDAPPLLPVTDAAVLSVLSDGCVLATRFGKTRRPELKEAAEALRRIDAKLLGVVLNRVPLSAGAARGYGYGYGYGYSYEADAGRETTDRPGRVVSGQKPIPPQHTMRHDATAPMPAVRSAR